MIEFYNGMTAMLPANLKSHIIYPKLSSPPVSSDYPYVLLHGLLGDDFSGEVGDASLGDQLDGKELRVKATYVGANADALSIIRKRCHTAWNRQILHLPGYKDEQLKKFTLTGDQADTSVTLSSGNHPLFAVDEYVLVASSL